MWWYEDVSRADFEAVKDMIEQIMLQLGASKYEIRLTYEVKTTSCSDDFELMNNIMDDAEPFPYDLSYEELCDEVKYSLGIEPYPQE